MKRLMPRRGTKEREDRKATTEEGMKNRTTHTACGREGWIVKLTVVQFPRTRLMRVAMPQLVDNL